MSWFGLGGGGSSSGRNETESHRKIDSEYENGSEFPTGFSGGSTQNEFSLGSTGNDFQKEVMAEQQKVMIQAVMLKLTNVSFEKCVPKPSSSLSDSEKSCISATVNKYLDTIDLVGGQLQGSP